MRANGHRKLPVGLDEHSHACLVYDTDQQLTGAVASYLEEGVELGQRIGCVGATEEEIEAAISGLEDSEGLLASGALILKTVDAVYGESSADSDFDQQLAVFAAATEEALADGYAGLRVAGLVTDLVKDPARRRSHTRWESFADHYMAANPLTALCCYDARRLPGPVLDDLAAVHPVSSGSCVPPPFRIYTGDDGRAIDGELDYFDCEALERLLILTETRPEDATLDLSRLTFVDHSAMLTIESYRRQAEKLGTRPRVHKASLPVGRTADLLEIEL